MLREEEARRTFVDGSGARVRRSNGCFRHKRCTAAGRCLRRNRRGKLRTNEGRCFVRCGLPIANMFCGFSLLKYMIGVSPTGVIHACKREHFSLGRSV